MATCPKCGKPMTPACPVSCREAPDVGGVEQKCDAENGALWVQVKDAKGVGLRGIGVTSPSANTTDAAGFAAFESLPQGTYTVTLAPLPAKVAEAHYLPNPTIDNVVVTVGTQVVTFSLKLKPSPTIALDAPRLLLVKHDYQGRPKPGVKAHRIPLKLGVDADYDGVGELSCTPGSVRVFENADDTDEKALPWKIPAGILKPGKTVYLEAKAPSGSLQGTELKLTLKQGGIPTRKTEASEKLTCVLVKLDVCKARPEDGSEPIVIDQAKKIEPGRAVLVQGASNTRLWAQRAKLVLSKAEPAAFAGKLVLKPLAGNVKAFAVEKAAPGQAAVTGDALKFANGGIDQAKGKVLWVQGVSQSASMGDSGWKVELEDLPDQEGDRVTMSVIKAELELYESRTVAPATAPKPSALSDADKFDKGRYLHLQNNRFHHGRALLVVKKVKPDGFEGKLVLTAYDAVHTPRYSANKSGAPKLKLFTTEVAAAGQAAEALPLQIAHPTTFPADGKPFWVEGATVSTALRDCELRLGVEEVDVGCDRVELTVVKFSNLKADVPTTQANLVRNRWTGGPSNSPTPRHAVVAGNNDDTKHFSDDFTVNLPLPLVEGSVTNADQVKLSVEIQPAGLDIPVNWSVLRAFDDAAGVKSLPGNSEDPGLTPNPANRLKATLRANGAGSYRVRAYIDCNGNAKFDERDASGARVDREPFILMNLVLFRVQCVNNLSVANSAASKAIPGTVRQPSGLRATAAGIPVAFSSGDFAGTGNDAVDMKAVIRVIGGGPAGLRGLEYLFAGWVNNELNCPTAPNPNHWGEDATHIHQRPAAIAGPRPLLGLRCYWELDGVRISGPILDAGGRYGNQRGTGGDSCIGTMAGAEPPVNKIADASGIGQRWTVANSDSPGGPIAAISPTDPQATLVRFKFNIDFQCALLAWTNVSRNAGPTDHAACRLYSTVQTNTWNIRFESTFDAALAETSVTPQTVTFTKDANGTRLATPVTGSGFETRAPGGLNAGKYDQPFNPAAPGVP